MLVEIKGQAEKRPLKALLVEKEGQAEESPLKALRKEFVCASLGGEEVNRSLPVLKWSSDLKGPMPDQSQRLS